MFDNQEKKDNNSNGYISISNGVESFNIKKSDLVWTRTGNHEHHYLPDFGDETEVYVALKCHKPGCIHGILHRKQGKDFMLWLEKSRATT